jgi:hypothetical protein
LSALQLVALARSGQMDALEQAWEGALANPGEVTPYCQAVEVLCAQNMAGRALALATAMIDALAESGRVADACSLGQAVVEHGAHNEALCRRLFELVELQHGEAPWYPLLKRMSRLGEGNLSTAAFTSFATLRCYTEGNVIYHRGGWGEGLVEKFDATREEVVIKFASGRMAELPLASVLDSFKPLDPDDFRTMRMVALPELKRLAQSQPGALIQKVARLFRGRVTSAQLKEVLCPQVVLTKDWNAFWKRAKSAASVDPWIQIEGSNTRPVFVLRKKPLSMMDEARRAMEFADDFGRWPATTSSARTTPRPARSSWPTSKTACSRS